MKWSILLGVVLWGTTWMSIHESPSSFRPSFHTVHAEQEEISSPTFSLSSFKKPEEEKKEEEKEKSETKLETKMETPSIRVPEEKNVISVQTPPPSQPKIIYLTFDDGPNRYTASILHFLGEQHIPATFFMLEPNMKSYASLVQRMKQDGHGLACHGVTHQRKKFYAHAESPLQEMKQCIATLQKVTGVTTQVIRTPYGSEPYLTPAQHDLLVHQHLYLWDWQVDSTDWKLPKEKMLEFIKAQVKRKKGNASLVILLHDHKSTVDILPSLLSFLKGEGYRFEAIRNETPPYSFWRK